MRLRHLEVIWAVARCRSMREAAIMLGVTQPALSQALRHAEDLLGYELFSRERGKLVPTPELRMMMPDIERVFAGVSAIRTRSLDMTRSQFGEIGVVAIPALTGEWLARATIRFRQLYPRVTIRVLSATAKTVLDHVVNHKAEIGLVHGPVADPAMRVTRLAESTIVAALHRSHPLALQETITVRDLQRCDVISLGSGNAPGDLVVAAFRKANLPIPSSVELTISSSAIIFVREGAGVALIDSHTARTFAFPEVVVRSLTPRIALEAALVVAADRPMTAHTVTFTGMLREVTKSSAIQ